MRLEKIITLANKKIEVMFTAMVNSLRSTGCNLPVYVIPYDDNKFDLPENCYWWEVDEVLEVIDKYDAWPACRKFQCFLTSNYQFVDSDIIFLRNPERVLENIDGFITSCTHWNNTDHTMNYESEQYIKSKTTTWQKNVFNSGQWACSEQIYQKDELLNLIQNKFKKIALLESRIYKDQPAINLLVNHSGIPINNMTLPPYNMESTWAGDYLSENYERYWKNDDVKPYLIHFAGTDYTKPFSINKLFSDNLHTENDLLEWRKHLEEVRNKKRKNGRKINKLKRGVKKTLRKVNWR